MLSEKKILIILLLLFLPNFSSSDYEFSFSYTSKYRCPSKYDDCFFNITNSNPYSPKIKNSYPEYNFDYDYYFINFIFYIPKSQKQKWFYFEAYEWKTKKSLISNGDCYFLNITEHIIFQFIYTKHLDVSGFNSFIQFHFFGLDPNFFMLVQAEFRYDFYFDFRAILIYDKYSIYKSEEKELKKYLDELEILVSEQRKRKDEALNHANKILNVLFHKAVDTSVEFTENIFEDVIDTPFFIVTITIETGLELSTDVFFEPEDYKISEINCFHGNIEFTSISILDDKVSIDNFLLKLISIFKNKIIDLVFSFEFKTDDFTITFSTNGYDSLDLTLKFINPENNTIFYEIVFKIKMKNQKLLEAVVVAQEFLVEAAEAIGTFLDENPFFIPLMILVIIFLLLLTSEVTVPATAGALVLKSSSVIMFLRNSFQFPIFEAANKALT